MSAPEPLTTIGSSTHRMTWVARIGVLVLVLILTITLIVFMGDTMTSVFATG